MVLNFYFALGIYYLEMNWTGSFLLLALFSSELIAKSSIDGATYINERDLENYYDSYYFSYHRLLMSLSYIYFGYEGSYLITLDLPIFFIVYFGSILLCHTALFIPESGEVIGWRFVLLQITTLLCIVFSLLLIAWVVTNFKGFTWFSPIITTPFFAVYNLISGLFT